MSKTKGGQSAASLVVYRILMVMVLLLVLLLLGGTVFGLMRNRGRLPTGQVPNKTQKTALSPDKSHDPEAQIFTGIGRIRASTAEPQSEMVILSITFPYLPEDKPFSEELDSKVRIFRNIIIDYFKSIPAEDLRARDESSVKAELLYQFNAALRLGHIETLYFNEFMIIE